MQNEHDDDAVAAADDLLIDGGEPTDQEAELAKALEAGDDADTSADADADDDGESGAADDAGADDQPDDAAEDDAAADDAPAAAAPKEEPAASDVSAAAPADPAPAAEKDFDAEAQALLSKYNDGDMDEEEYQTAQRALNREEAKFEAQKAVWEDRQQRAQAEQSNAFNDAALAWQNEHAEFILNPLHVDAVNRALEVIAAQKPQLTPAELIAEAGQVAMDAYGYTVPDKPTAADDKDKIARATASRRPAADKVPASLRNAPAAGSLDPSKSSFDQLDQLDISELEDAVARLPESKIQEFLRDAPGAGSRGS